MKNKFILIYFAIFFCLTWNSMQVWAAPNISAQSAVVIEKESGRILYEKNAEKEMPMASTTKIMTALLALEEGNLEDKITISATAAGVEGSSMYLQEGETFTLKELLYGLMLSSGNDAAVAIAEHFGGTEAFVKKMNEKASQLKAKHTHFANPNGLPDDTHYSTALDMANITAQALNNPAFSEITSTQTYKISGDGKAVSRTLINHNKLLKLCEGCLGVKTGFTKAAGRCLVSAVCRNNMTLICVTLNAPDDWNDHCSLYDFLFETYHMETVVQSGRSLGTIPILDSDTTELTATSASDFCYPLRSGEQCVTSLTLTPDLIAPVSDGTECGKISVLLNGKELASLPLKIEGSAEARPTLKKIQYNLYETLSRFYQKWLTLLGT
ncbi:D-alanyl-D-alanine carboxypeptidase family protein [Ructibacterium gallinarum]|uniref:serine-type D-Ala-D-Ala carboxypeptidase n=1 Tax=Ructibacterium gallinarum TaxID=2779355 RepID=A0A9D5M4N9_9FIRM|nr:D-alanyl-D-alanine carboxypeptidase family protein [Ructibacterium gallinarum]MBE5040649.1 D-alanyl-D-alanine carboxypeptidase [Ructibacterium gallinarum]